MGKRWRGQEGKEVKESRDHQEVELGGGRDQREGRGINQEEDRDDQLEGRAGVINTEMGDQEGEDMEINKRGGFGGINRRINVIQSFCNNSI